MEQFVASVTKINSAVNGFVWGPVMLAAFLLIGLMFTVRTGFFQVTKIKHWWSTTIMAAFRDKSVRRTDDRKAISQFQSLCTALAATVGTGNIVGVATAIATGGPGAIFWMWLAAFLGMMTNFAENVLGIKYRYKNEKDEWVGGAMIYMDRGLHCKPLAIIFSIFCVLASFGIGNMSQANSIATALHDSFSLPKLAIGLVLMVTAGLVILGGIKRIARFTEKFVPFMAVFYILGGLVCVGLNYQAVPAAFASIFREAFNFSAAFGGAVGYGISRAMRQGISRGVFSNEAGLGSSVMVHSASDVKEPVVQGMWGVFEVFADTIVICTITALVVLTSGVYQQNAYQDYYLVKSAQVSEIAADTAERCNTVWADASLASEARYDALLDEVRVGIDRVRTECDIDEGAPVVLYDAVDSFQAVISAGRQVLAKSTEVDAVRLNADLATMLEDAMLSIDTDTTVINGAPLTASSFNRTLGKVNTSLGSFAQIFVSIALTFFAFSTILSWSFYGQRGIEYLFGIRAVPIYKIIFLALMVVGCMAKLDLVWDLSDTFNGLMAIPNLIAITLLSGKVIEIVRDYWKRKKEGQLEG